MIRSIRFTLGIVAAVFVLLLISACAPSQQYIISKYTTSESKFIDIDGLRVHYRDEGKGSVLLCLHGIQSSLHTWDGWVKEMKNHYRIIRIDLPGWGFTGASNFGYGRNETVKFLKKFVDAMGLKKINIAGNSYGGFLAWNFVVDNQDMVDKLIILDAAGYPFKPPSAVTLMTAPVIRNLYPIITPRFMVAKYTRDVYGTKSRVTDETIDRYYHLMMYNDNRKESVKFFQEIIGQFEMESASVKTIKKPTLIMWGRQDNWIPLSVMERFKKDIPHARVIVYDGTGHVPMEEIPEITAKDADAFLSGK